MELQQLRYVCAIADTGSFSKAAVRTRVAQPSLSQQIGKLEAELGAPLFDRLGRSVQLTASGRAFLLRARVILRELEAARADAAEHQGSVNGPVTIGVIPTVAPYFLPAVLSAFAHAHPAVAISIVEEITPLLLDKLRSSAIDVAIIALPVQTRPTEFTARPLLREKLFAVLPHRHALARRSALSLNELRTESFLLMRDGHCFRETAVAACRRARLQPRISFESGQFNSILAMVGAGLGVSIVPAMAVERRRGCVFVPLEDERAARVIGAVTMTARYQVRAAEAFLAVLMQHAQLAAADLP